MKRIINGKRYDTEKAIVIGLYDAGLPRSDFNHLSVGLYKTPRSGQYFLAGSGGALTGFAESLPGGGRTGGHRVIPIEPDEALEWAERHLSTEEVEKHFGDLVEDA